MKKTVLLLLLSIMTSSMLTAQNIYKIPEEIKLWEKWIENTKDKNLETPYMVGNAGYYKNVWNSSIDIDITKSRLTFSQNVTVFNKQWNGIPKGLSFDEKSSTYTSDWVEIPSGENLGATDIKIDGNSVLSKGDRETFVKVARGNHTISGEITWEEMPKSIKIPNEIAIINIKENGKSVTISNRDSDGRIYFSSLEEMKNSAFPDSVDVVEKPQDELHVKVYKKLTDDIPIVLEANIELSVTGEDREVVVGRLLGENYEVISVQSSIPATVDENGMLKAQVKQGVWNVSVVSRQITFDSLFSFEKVTEEYPEQEIWCYQLNNDLRTSEIVNVNSIDPTSINMPSNWKNLSTFVVQANDTLKIKEGKRGQSEKEKSKLSLAKEMWLTFNGDKFIQRDEIVGTIGKSQRLSVNEKNNLGNIELDGLPQIITKDDKDSIGIEVKEGNISVVATSSAERKFSNDLSGWNSDFKDGQFSLNLPPGWDVFWTDGFTYVSESFIGKWNLWDLFFTIVIFVVILKIVGVSTAILALLTIAFTYHESSAPLFIWLNLAITFGLLKVFPENKFKKMIRNYRNVVYLTLIVMVVGYSISKMRVAVYPQLNQQDLVYNTDYSSGSNRQFVSKRISMKDDYDAQANSAILSKAQEERKEEKKSFYDVTTQGGGEPKARTTSKGVLGLVSGSIKGASVKNTNPFENEQFSSNAGEGFGAGSNGVADLLYGAGSASSVKQQIKGNIKAPSPTIVSGDKEDQSRSEAAIRRVVIARIGGLKYLYNKFLKENTTMAGKISVKMVIAPSGSISNAEISESNINNRAFEGEVVARIKNWKFSKSEKGSTTIIYPFEFTSNGAPEFKNEFASNETEDQKIDMSYGADDVIQTGPAIPKWSWKKIDLRVEGEIDKGQKFKLLLISPIMSRVINLFKALSVIMLCGIFIFFGFKKDEDKIRIAKLLKSLKAKAIVPLLLALFVTVSYNNVHADNSNSDDCVVNLDEYEKYLFVDSDCKPECISIKKGKITAEKGEVSIKISVDSYDQSYFRIPGNSDNWLPTSVLNNGKTATLSLENRSNLYVVLNKGKNEIELRGKLSNDITEILFPFSMKNVDVVTSKYSVAGIEKRVISQNSNVVFRYTGKEQVKKNIVDDTKKEVTKYKRSEKPFFVLNRHIILGFNEWVIKTTVSRVAPSSGATQIDIPLLESESVISDGVTVKDSVIQVQLLNGQNYFSWESRINIVKHLTFTATKDGPWVETWALTEGTKWHTEIAGIKKNTSGYIWSPRAGESIEISISKPISVQGKTKTIQSFEVRTTPGKKSNSINIYFNVQSSKGNSVTVTLPPLCEIEELKVDNIKNIQTIKDDKLTIKVEPGTHSIAIDLKQRKTIEIFQKTPKISVDTEVANVNLEYNLPSDRWLLFIGGPTMGPALMMWGILFALLIFAVILGKTKITPLRGIEWFLIFFGLSTVSNFGGVFLIIWFVIFQAKESGKITIKNNNNFNLVQVVLAILTIIALASLVFTIPNGLLSSPTTYVVGNGSSSYYFKWYVDYASSMVPQGFFVSLPMWVYKVIMLLWAAWLGIKLPNWVKWAWGIYVADGIWKKVEKKIVPKIEKAKVIEKVVVEEKVSEETETKE